MTPIFKLTTVLASMNQESILLISKLTSYLWRRIFTVWILDANQVAFALWVHQTTSREGSGWMLFLAAIRLETLLQGAVVVCVSKADGYGIGKKLAATGLST